MQSFTPSPPASNQVIAPDAIGVSNSGFSPWENETVLTPLYDRLRSIARARMAGAFPTVGPTGLVNEVMVRLLGAGRRPAAAEFQDETHFIATACTAMRQVLVDYARRKSAGKRAGGSDWSVGDPWSEFQLQLSPESLLDIHRELEDLAKEDEPLARLVEMRVFGGLTFAEIGALLGMETKTAERRWRYATAVLRTRLKP